MWKQLSLIAVIWVAPLLGESLAGKYKVTGYDPYLEREYEGVAYLKQTGENIYNGYWEVDDPVETYSGTGILDGKTLTFVFKIKNNHGRNLGIQTYHIVEEGKLIGKWIFFGGDKTGMETLLKITPESKKTSEESHGK